DLHHCLKLPKLVAGAQHHAPVVPYLPAAFTLRSLNEPLGETFFVLRWWCARETFLLRCCFFVCISDKALVAVAVQPARIFDALVLWIQSNTDRLLNDANVQIQTA